MSLDIRKKIVESKQVKVFNLSTTTKYMIRELRNFNGSLSSSKSSNIFIQDPSGLRENFQCQ